ncbi:hypothetical protein LEP1GSC170_1209 [Leptospira interrogans serovar Bataviae str. HAI135]|nr:hypothetical protein LEP1GSC170_1209 [Leptospira interrogans serovar Bataviae str. HAI135]
MSIKTDTTPPITINTPKIVEILPLIALSERYFQSDFLCFVILYFLYVFYPIEIRLYCILPGVPNALKTSFLGLNPIGATETWTQVTPEDVPSLINWWNGKLSLIISSTMFFVVSPWTQMSAASPLICCDVMLPFTFRFTAGDRNPEFTIIGLSIACLSGSSIVSQSLFRFAIWRSSGLFSRPVCVTVISFNVKFSVRFIIFS